MGQEPKRQRDEKVSVPSVIGQTWSVASAALSRVGLQAAAKNDRTTGTCSAESPASGSTVDVGSTVTLTMSTDV